MRTATQTPARQVHYLRREGEFAPVSYALRTSQTTKDYGDFVVGGTQNFPSWCANDPGRFFTQAAASERLNGYYAFAVQFSLPRELSHAQHMALTKDFMEATMPDLPALWVKHDKRLDNGDMHPHIHILLSSRRIDGIERNPEQTFARWNSHNPSQGGSQKELFWSQQHAPERLRQAFADISNYHLELGGAKERLDPRALHRRGIQRQPIRWGNTRPTAEKIAAEQRKAVVAWKQRKVYKGLGAAQDIPREEMVLLVRQWTRGCTPETRLPRISATEVETWYRREEDQLMQDITRREQQLVRLTLAQEGQLRPHEVQALLRPSRIEEYVGHGLKARIFEDEPGYRY
jgi:hypothetical protein